MDRISDERIAFYLKHQEQIEEWAAIAEDVPLEADKFLRSLDTDILRLKQEKNVYPWTWDDDPAWYGYFIVEPNWLEGSEKPVAACGIAWRPASVDFRRDPPHVGIWADQKHPRGKKIHDEIALYVSSNRRYQSNRELPACIPVTPERGDHFWEDLRPYRRKLIDTLEEVWDYLENAVTKALS